GDFFIEQAVQPALDCCSAGAGTAVVALGGPGAAQQPARGQQRKTAPANCAQLGGELLRRSLTYLGILATGAQARTPVADQRIQCFAQLTARSEERRVGKVSKPRSPPCTECT